MSTRNIKTSITTDAELNKLSDFEFRVWVSLITVADDNGVFPKDSNLLKDTIFPLRPSITRRSVVDAVCSLELAGLISDFTAEDGRSYLYFPSWANHQRVRNKTTKYPNPPENCVAAARREKKTLAAARREEKKEENEEEKGKRKNQRKRLKEEERVEKKESFTAPERTRADACIVLDYLNDRLGTRYRQSKSSLANIQARLNDGFSIEECKKVVDTKCAEWLNTDMAKYLNPETLFRPSHFEKYLNQLSANHATAAEIEQLRAIYGEAIRCLDQEDLDYMVYAMKEAGSIT